MYDGMTTLHVAHLALCTVTTALSTHSHHYIYSTVHMETEFASPLDTYIN